MNIIGSFDILFSVSILSCKNGKFWHFRFFIQSSMWSTDNWLSIFITYFHIDKFRFLLHTTRDGLYYIKWCKNLLNPDNFTQLYFPCFSCKKYPYFCQTAVVIHYYIDKCDILRFFGEIKINKITCELSHLFHSCHHNRKYHWVSNNEKTNSIFSKLHTTANKSAKCM
jgi:hypothetical protein